MLVPRKILRLGLLFSTPPIVLVLFAQLGMTGAPPGDEDARRIFAYLRERGQVMGSGKLHVSRSQGEPLDVRQLAILNRPREASDEIPQDSKAFLSRTLRSSFAREGSILFEGSRSVLWAPDHLPFKVALYLAPTDDGVVCYVLRSTGHGNVAGGFDDTLTSGVTVHVAPLSSALSVVFGVRSDMIREVAVTSGRRSEQAQTPLSAYLFLVRSDEIGGITMSLVYDDGRIRRVGL
jgi:hypothetical protein